MIMRSLCRVGIDVFMHVSWCGGWQITVTVAVGWGLQQLCEEAQVKNQSHKALRAIPGSRAGAVSSFLFSALLAYIYTCILSHVVDRSDVLGTFLKKVVFEWCVTHNRDDTPT